MIHIDSSRAFRLWEYRVSHDLMLLRSPKNPELAGYERTIDIIFYGVHYLHLPTKLGGVRITSGHPIAETRPPGMEYSASNQSTAYSLISQGKCHSLIADSIKIEENDLELWESRLNKEFPVIDS